MTNVIYLGDWRKKEPSKKDTEYAFTLQVHEGPEALITDYFDDGQDAGSRLLKFAKMLDTLSYWMKQQAEDMTPSIDGDCLAQIHVYENSRVVMRFNDAKITTPEQREWLRERLDDAKDLVV